MKNIIKIHTIMTTTQKDTTAIIKTAITIIKDTIKITTITPTEINTNQNIINEDHIINGILKRISQNMSRIITIKITS